MHMISAISLGFIGFMIIYSLYSRNEIKASYHLVGMFTFCFALALGVLWEMLEFALDSLWKINMQKSGLIDTMSDLIIDSIGALVASVLGYLYVRFNKGPIFNRFITDFVKKNPQLFKKTLLLP